MSDYEKKDIKAFADVESPHRRKSFEQTTGDTFVPEVRHKILDLGNGYGTTKPIEEARANCEE